MSCPHFPSSPLKHPVVIESCGSDSKAMLLPPPPRPYHKEPLGACAVFRSSLLPFRFLAPTTLTQVPIHPCWPVSMAPCGHQREMQAALPSLQGLALLTWSQLSKPWPCFCQAKCFPIIPLIQNEHLFMLQNSLPCLPHKTTSPV